MISEKLVEAHIFDVDDTIVNREWYTRLLQVARVYFLGTKTLDRLFKKYNNEEDIPEFDNTLPKEDAPLKLRERMSKFFHSTRTVIPGVLGLLNKLNEKSIPLFIATGRRNHTEWAEMTNESLDMNKIDFFPEKFFTPSEMKSAVNKAIVIKDKLKKYGRIEFYEDDVETAVFLALTFGDDVKINLIYHKLNIPLYNKLQIKTLPNIKLYDITKDKYIYLDP